MTKKYFAQGTILTEVVLLGNIHKRIRFDECRGGSYYMTSNKDIQKALEQHSDFNNGFILQESYGEPDPDEQEPEQTETAAEPANDVQTESTIKVASIAEARDFLADNFGIAKSTLRSKTAILAAAEEHNITFEGI